MSAVAKAASVTPPNKVIVRATVATAEHIKLPRNWYKAYIAVVAETEDVYVIVDTAATTAVSASGTSTTDGSGYMQPIATGADHIPAGTEKHYDLMQLDPKENEDVYVHHISAGTTGKIRIKKASGSRSN